MLFNFVYISDTMIRRLQIHTKIGIIFRLLHKKRPKKNENIIILHKNVNLPLHIIVIIYMQNHCMPQTGIGKNGGKRKIDNRLL